MRIARLTALLTALCLALCGCSISREVEHQAYVLVMGLDKADGGVELTIRIPKIGMSKGDGGDDASPYLVFGARGSDFSQALEAMQLAVPRELNLSHLKLLIVSEALAGDAAFPTLINRVAEQPHLYTTARFVVCEGSAKAFVEAQKTVIGTRLSAEIDAEFTHYAEHGAIPDTTFADVYYASNSIYSDPIATRGFFAEGVEESQPALLTVDPSESPGVLAEAPSKEFFAGTAIFRDGRLAGRLDAAETLLLNLALGKRETFAYDCGGKAYWLTPEGSPDRRVEIDDGAVRVGLSLRLSTIDAVSPEEARCIEGEIAAALEALIQKCQRVRLEPFGFAETAAGHFLTVPEWLAFDWRERFAAAEVEARVALSCPAAR